jgi:hypothetical protein
MVASFGEGLPAFAILGKDLLPRRRDENAPVVTEYVCSRERVRRNDEPAKAKIPDDVGHAPIEGDRTADSLDRAIRAQFPGEHQIGKAFAIGPRQGVAPMAT